MNERFRIRLLLLCLWLTLAGLAVGDTPLLATADYRGGGDASPLAQGGTTTYTVRRGDTLSGIAARFGVSVSSLMALNGLRNADAIRIGQTLRIPTGGRPSVPDAAVKPGREGPNERLAPDSEVVYSPAYIGFDVKEFAQKYRGYLATFSERAEGETMTGPQIVQTIAERFSVGPRVLLTVLEMRGGWVTGNPVTARQRDYPMDITDRSHKGLYYQLWRAANFLNQGYYGKLLGRQSLMQLEDDSSYVRYAAGVNPGTAAVQNLLTRSSGYSEWLTQLSRFKATYQRLFGDPFGAAIEPLVPSDIKQPLLRIPFEDNHVWYFTGGPHGAWADGSAWGAVDFAPNGPGGCYTSQEWVVAPGAGRIAQAEHGRVMLNLDGGNYQGQGWTVMLMHVASKARVSVGSYVFMGDHIGHPSCEGGYSQATHTHVARMYNGQWLSVVGDVPFEMGGWVFKGSTAEYDGTMTRADATKPAINGHVERLNAVRGELGPSIMSLINMSP